MILPWLVSNPVRMTWQTTALGIGVFGNSLFPSPSMLLLGCDWMSSVPPNRMCRLWEPFFRLRLSLIGKSVRVSPSLIRGTVSPVRMLSLTIAEPYRSTKSQGTILWGLEPDLVLAASLASLRELTLRAQISPGASSLLSMETHSPLMRFALLFDLRFAPPSRNTYIFREGSLMALMRLKFTLLCITTVPSNINSIPSCINANFQYSSNSQRKEYKIWNTNIGATMCCLYISKKEGSGIRNSFFCPISSWS